MTDEDARVVRGDGVPVRGLYAAGNTSASVMGRTYPYVSPVWNFEAGGLKRV